MAVKVCARSDGVALTPEAPKWSNVRSAPSHPRAALLLTFSASRKLTRRSGLFDTLRFVKSLYWEVKGRWTHPMAAPAPCSAIFMGSKPAKARSQFCTACVPLSHSPESRASTSCPWSEKARYKVRPQCRICRRDLSSARKTRPMNSAEHGAEMPSEILSVRCFAGMLTPREAVRGVHPRPAHQQDSPAGRARR